MNSAGGYPRAGLINTEEITLSMMNYPNQNELLDDTPLETFQNISNWIEGQPVDYINRNLDDILEELNVALFHSRSSFRIPLTFHPNHESTNLLHKDDEFPNHMRTRIAKISGFQYENYKHSWRGLEYNGQSEFYIQLIEAFDKRYKKIFEERAEGMTEVEAQKEWKDFVEDWESGNIDIINEFSFV
jgi:hypothetical protein